MTKSRSKKRKRRFKKWLHTDFVLSAIKSQDVFVFAEDREPKVKTFHPKIILRKTPNV